MDYHIYSSILAAIFSFVIGTFVFLKNRKNKLNRAFFLFNISICIWNISDFIVKISISDEQALLWDRIGYIGAFFIPYFCAAVNFYLINKRVKDYKKFFVYSWISLLFLLSINFTPFFIKGVSRIPFREEPGILYIVFVIYFLIAVLYSLYELFIFYKKCEKGYKKEQLKYGLIGISIGAIGVIFYFITLVSPDFPVLHYFIEMGYISIFAYAIIKHNLMEIDLAWRKLAKEVVYYVVFIFYIGTLFYLLDKSNLSIYANTIIAIFAILFYLLFHSKFKIFLHNLFLGKYKKIWDTLKKNAQIKSDMFDNMSVINILVLDISNALNLTYAAYYELIEFSDKYKILIAEKNLIKR